jgi:hypothetical protein
VEEAIKSTEKWDDVKPLITGGEAAPVKPGAHVLIHIENGGTISGLLEKVDEGDQSVQLKVAGAAKTVVFATLLLLAVSFGAIGCAKATAAVPGAKKPFMTSDADAHKAIDTARTFARAVQGVVTEQAQEDRAAMEKCSAAAKGANPPVPLPEPREPFSIRAYTNACHNLGVELPFDLSALNSLNSNVTELAPWADNSHVVRLSVKCGEAESWRLPATMEPLAQRVAALLAAVDASKVAIPVPVLAETRRTFELK